MTIGTSERPDLPLAVVVGAGGMGRAIARRMGQRYRLLIADRDAQHLEAFQVQLRAEGYDVSVQQADVTSSADLEMLATRAVALAPIAALINVVGLSPSMGDFSQLIEVNIIGATRVAETFRDLLAAPGCGIFISSMAAHLHPLEAKVQALMDDPLKPGFFAELEASLAEPATPQLAYVLSKSALNRMCRREAGAWGARGLRILSLSPGLIATPMGALEFERQPMKHDLLAATPLQREGTMLEIADAVEFLASSKASFISGTDILIDGGLTGTLQHRKPSHTTRG